MTSPSGWPPEILLSFKIPRESDAVGTALRGDNA